jgi:predicted esterase
VVFHGIGYLSRYFLKHFKHLDPDTNYILAPQAPALYYLNNKYTHVGASWLTKEETQIHMQNLLQFLDVLWETEQLDKAQRLILFGYSQGVSVLARWIAQRKLNPAEIMLYAGKLPAELQSHDFDHLSNTTKVTAYYGTDDPYLEHWNRESLKNQAYELFGKRLIWQDYTGGHELLDSLILDPFK